VEILFGGRKISKGSRSFLQIMKKIFFKKKEDFCHPYASRQRSTAGTWLTSILMWWFSLTKISALCDCAVRLGNKFQGKVLWKTFYQAIKAI